MWPKALLKIIQNFNFNWFLTLSCKLNVNPHFRDVIQKCLQFEPESRPTVRQLLRHPMFDLAQDVTAAIMDFKRISASQTRDASFLSKPAFGIAPLIAKNQKEVEKDANFITLGNRKFKVLNQTQKTREPGRSNRATKENTPSKSPVRKFIRGRQRQIPTAQNRQFNLNKLKSVDLARSNRGTGSQYNYVERFGQVVSPPPKVKNLSFIYLIRLD